jgi:predicted ATPase/class 3 adenylate cyclase
MTVRALLFTDVVDSTRMVERLGDPRAAEVWAEHDRRARDLLALHRGREIGRADGFFLLFDDPADAARYALAYHQALAGLALTARVGIHVGPVTLRENPPEDIARGAIGTEVEGLTTPLTARVMALARGGQTLLSAAARNALGDVRLEGAQIARHGHYRFKGIEEPVEIFELGVCDSSPLSPPTDVDKAYRVVRAGDFWRPVREVRHNLPAERDAFVGRTAELRALAARLDTGTRLVTVLGPGGTGKTRFVRRFGRTWLGDWPGGVYFCDLSEARTRDGIFFAVASALEVPLGKEDPVVQLGHAIAGRGRSLVILDNFEQVVEHAPATLGVWLDHAPDAAFVVTSRERLHLPGEEVFPVEPLSLEMDAVELFAARARAQKPDFTLDGSSRAAVAEIVRLLDGLPLAIELAAARVRVLSPAQIVARMRDRFNLLAGARGAGARQATLRAAIDWSWDLLVPWEQSAFAQCSIFDGGFTLEAAEAVLDLSASPDAPPVIDAIQALLDKSLLRTWHPKATGRLDMAEPFFGMYLSLHQYASEKLHAFGERASGDTEQRHGRYFAGFGSDQALDAQLTHGGVLRRQMLAMELDNLVSACRRAIERREPDLSAACFLAAWTVLEAQGPYDLAAALGRQVAALDGLAPHHISRVLMATAHALRTVGQVDAANAVLDQALAVARQSQDRRAEAMAMRHLAMARHRDGHVDEAHQHFGMALDLLARLNDRPGRGVLLANLANLQMERGLMAEARASYDAALALHREVGNRAAEGIALGNLATLHHELGHAAEARVAYDNALLIHREAGSLLQEAITLCNLGILVNQQGDRSEAAAHYHAALKIHREIGNRRGEGVVLGQIGDLCRALGEFEPARVHYEEALRVHREVGNRHFEGAVLADLGAMLVAQGQVDAGLRAMETGERLLRQVDDPLTLAKLLCMKGSAAWAGGHADAARSALAEAESISARLGAAPASDLGQQIETLRRSLD